MRPRHPFLARQRGIAAIELAIIFCMSFVIMPLLLLFGRVLWHYTVMRGATHDAIQSLATGTSADLAGANASAMEEGARQVLMEDMAEARLEPVFTSSTYMTLRCVATATECSLKVDTHISDPAMGLMLSRFLDPATGQLPLSVESTVPHATRPLSY